MPVVDGVGKPAGVRCIQLADDLRCRLFGRPERPAVCVSLRPMPEMCGETREQAMRWLGVLEEHTAPPAPGEVSSSPASSPPPCAGPAPRDRR